MTPETRRNFVFLCITLISDVVACFVYFGRLTTTSISALFFAIMFAGTMPRQKISGKPPRRTLPRFRPSKRQRTGALQDASRSSSAPCRAPASWTAAALRRFSPPAPNAWKTSNIQHSTSNAQGNSRATPTWKLGVECWLLNVSSFSPRPLDDDFNLRLVFLNHVRGQDAHGVRQSSGAAMCFLAWAGHILESVLFCRVAAPGDGHTPLHRAARLAAGRWARRGNVLAS